jgi:hypothetical protein
MAVLDVEAPGADRLTLPAEAKDPRFRTLFDYWQTKAPPGLLPGRQHIDPLELKDLLPYVVLFDVVRQPGGYRFRHRLVGTHVHSLLPAITSGSFVDEIAHAEHYKRLHYPEMLDLVETHRPHYAERRSPVMPEHFTYFCRLKLPLASDGRTVDMILGLYIGMRADGRLTTARLI